MNTVKHIFAAQLLLMSLSVGGSCTFDGGGLEGDGGGLEREGRRSLARDGAVFPADEGVAREGALSSDAREPRTEAGFDMRADAAPLADAVDLDAGSDSTPGKDARAPADADASTDAAPAVLLDESFEVDSGEMLLQRGTWEVTSGGILQSATEPNGAIAVAELPESDYVLQTALVINGIQGVPSLSEGAGLAARVQEEQPATGTLVVAQYACVVTPEAGGRLALGKASGSEPAYARLADTSARVPLKTGITIRFTVRGDQLICELPDQQVRIATNDGSYGGGTVGLVTLHASTYFEYFLALAIGEGE
jgi:hypothetical protein